MLVMRIIGRRFQLSVRIVPFERVSPIADASFAVAQISGEQAVGDDRSALRGNAFVVVGKSAEAGAMFEPRVGDDVHDVRAVFQFAQLFGGQETHAGEIRFLPEHAVEFDGMADRFVNLQAKLRAAQNNGAESLPDIAARECSSTASSAVRCALPTRSSDSISS